MPKKQKPIDSKRVWDLVLQGLLKADEEHYRVSLQKNFQKQSDRVKRLWKSGLREIEREPTVLGNPLYPWFAFLQCHEEGLNIPDWVMEYFVTAARELRLLSFHDWEALDFQTRIAEVFGFKTPGRSGRGNLFSDYKKTQQEVQLARAMHDTVKDGSQLKYSSEHVAKDVGVNERTVRRAYQKHRHLLSRKDITTTRVSVQRKKSGA